ncbi:hypothetical protein M406DRAFT_322042 [Cryphonectria parasitica EP155]|uniref:DUF2470 domain-containing protein n=1 Tax=Cryphonectria parasitica (strain ATCC 38755 / EP155) TaxID=660469 RepID=A0A9P5CPY6_CRYP1|nr:uncharacterized protein M406DRAFT_322042 [Cryphonectria parasitica EP155]KAF3765681.1 hypothetical protein M406DRAFT_322042 [Cryphonectria parasitica EP155]
MVTTRASTAAPTPSPAGSALEIDPVSKARTITHMNKDHAADMSAILRHHARLSEAQAADAEMLDLDLATMTIRSAAGVQHVALDPPMGTWSDRRTRLADMTIEARAALGLPPPAEGGGAAAVAWYPPQGVGILSFTGVIWYFVSATLVLSGHARPGSGLWQFAKAIHFPGGPETYVWLVRFLLVPMIAIHVAEAVYMARSRLAPAQVPVVSTVWLLWVATTFFEGVTAWQRWDRLVLRKQKKA